VHLHRNEHTPPAPGPPPGAGPEARRVPVSHGFRTASALTIEVCSCRDYLRNNPPKIACALIGPPPSVSKPWSVNCMFRWGRAGHPAPPTHPLPFTWPRGSEQPGVAWSKAGGPSGYRAQARAPHSAHHGNTQEPVLPAYPPTWGASPSRLPGPSLRDGVGSTSKAHPGQEAVSGPGRVASPLWAGPGTSPSPTTFCLWAKEVFPRPTHKLERGLEQASPRCP